MDKTLAARATMKRESECEKKYLALAINLQTLGVLLSIDRNDTATATKSEKQSPIAPNENNSYSK